MKKIILLLSVAVLLTACQPAATPEPTAIPPTVPAPTPAPVEALAASASDLVGVWWFSQGGVMLEYKADGTYRVYSGSAAIGEIDKGTYTFDAGKINSISTGTCVNKPAIYEAYVTKQDGKPVSLRLQAVGTDECSSRANITASTAKFRNP